MGRHHPGSELASRWPTITPTRNRIAVLALSAVGLTVCSVAGIGDNWAPDGRAASSAPLSFPTTDQADDPVARGGPLGGPLALPVLAPAGTPVWEPAKGTVIADGLPLGHPRSTGSTATRATRTTAPPEVAGPVAPPATTPPPAGDPLTDDGKFGDGCEQPGTPERCDPVVGLPPVVVQPKPDCADPLVECACDHDVATDCAGNPRTPIGLPPVDEEEPPVDDPAVEEPVTEVAG